MELAECIAIVSRGSDLSEDESTIVADLLASGDQNAAEKAELLGLGQSLIYTIQQTDVPMMLVVLRKGTAAAHYVMGGPTANRHNTFTLGTAASEIYVMHGETAAVATYARRLVKEKDAGRPLEPIIEKMNELAQRYRDTSGPEYCAHHGFVDEIVKIMRCGELARAADELTALALARMAGGDSGPSKPDDLTIILYRLPRQRRTRRGRSSRS